MRGAQDGGLKKHSPSHQLSKKKLKQPMKPVKEQQCAEAIPPDSTMGRRAERASIPGDWLYSNACRSL